MNFKPLGDRVLVEPTPDKHEGSLLIPDKILEDTKPDKGVIVMKGDCTVAVNVGDTVYFTKRSGSLVKLDGKAYLVINSRDLQGVLR
jgi:chaperonin GroES